uniref:Uncharacterized protein n=1 Tax=Rhodosorus marinus TaxID=101924 RepID=A0A7S0BDR9_9RHOD
MLFAHLRLKLRLGFRYYRITFIANEIASLQSSTVAILGPQTSAPDAVVGVNAQSHFTAINTFQTLHGLADVWKRHSAFEAETGSILFDLRCRNQRVSPHFELD